MLDGERACVKTGKANVPTNPYLGASLFAREYATSSAGAKCTARRTPYAYLWALGKPRTYIYGPLNMSELISMRADGRAGVAKCAPEELILQAACARGRPHAYAVHVLRIHIPQTGVCGGGSLQGWMIL